MCFERVCVERWGRHPLIGTRVLVHATRHHRGHLEVRIQIAPEVVPCSDERMPRYWSYPISRMNGGASAGGTYRSAASCCARLTTSCSSNANALDANASAATSNATHEPVALGVTLALPSYLVVPVPVPVLPDGLAPCVEPDAAFEPALPERRAFSRAMHASLSLAGTLAQVAVGSSGRFAGTRSPDVVAVVAVEPAAGACNPRWCRWERCSAPSPRRIFRVRSRPQSCSSACSPCRSPSPTVHVIKVPSPRSFCRPQHSGSGRQRMLV